MLHKPPQAQPQPPEACTPGVQAALRPHSSSPDDAPDSFDLHTPSSIGGPGCSAAEQAWAQAADANASSSNASVSAVLQPDSAIADHAELQHGNNGVPAASSAGGASGNYNSATASSAEAAAGGAAVQGAATRGAVGQSAAEGADRGSSAQQSSSGAVPDSSYNVNVQERGSSSTPLQRCDSSSVVTYARGSGEYSGENAAGVPRVGSNGHVSCDSDDRDRSAYAHAATIDNSDTGSCKAGAARCRSAANAAHGLDAAGNHTDGLHVRAATSAVKRSICAGAATAANAGPHSGSGTDSAIAARQNEGVGRAEPPGDSRTTDAMDSTRVQCGATRRSSSGASGVVISANTTLRLPPGPDRQPGACDALSCSGSGCMNSMGDAGSCSHGRTSSSSASEAAECQSKSSVQGALASASASGESAASSVEPATQLQRLHQLAHDVSDLLHGGAAPPRVGERSAQAPNASRSVDGLLHSADLPHVASPAQKPAQSPGAHCFVRAT